MSPRLPHHRRYQWRIMAKHNRPAIYGLLGIALLLVLIYSAEEYLLEHNLRLDRDNEVADLLAANLRPPLGAPGTTQTDHAEGTAEVCW